MINEKDSQCDAAKFALCSSRFNTYKKYEGNKSLGIMFSLKISGLILQLDLKTNKFINGSLTLKGILYILSNPKGRKRGF